MKTNKTILSLAFLAFVLLNAQAQSLKVEQVKENTFHIWVANPKSKLTWNIQPDSWKTAKVLPLKTADETVTLTAVHPILKAEMGKEKPMYAAPRAVMLQGAVNFRDLGGYMTKDSKQVKWGKIYRSADISKLTEADLKVVQSLNIKMVCDLRGEKEAEAAPDKLVAGTDRILLPAGSENVTGNPTDWMK